MNFCKCGHEVRFGRQYCTYCRRVMLKDDNNKTAVIFGIQPGSNAYEDIEYMRGNKMTLTEFKDFCIKNEFDGVIVDVNGIRHIVRNNEVVKMEEVTE